MRDGWREMSYKACFICCGMAVVLEFRLQPVCPLAESGTLAYRLKPEFQRGTGSSRNSNTRERKFITVGDMFREPFIYQGKSALITGASAGIGEAFACELARRGMTLVLVSRSLDVLDTLAQRLRQEHGVRVEVIAADLSQAGSIGSIKQTAIERGLTVDLLVNNAGFMTYGRFETLDPAEDQGEVLVNVAAVVDLCHAFLPEMLARQQGGIINVASIVAFQPIPFMAVYAASKAFVLSFSLALAEEVGGRGVRVVTLCPGPTSTQLFVRAKSTKVSRGKQRTPAQVVATALSALDRQQCVVVDGWRNKLLTCLASLLPRRLTAKIAGRMVRPK